MARHKACRENSCKTDAYADGRCIFHFKHLDRPSVYNGPDNVLVKSRTTSYAVKATTDSAPKENS